MAVKGLFGGPTPQDIRQLMNQENELRIRQAGQDSRAGGYQAQLMSQATERSRQALGNIFGGAMGAFGMKMPQDPRLARAVKRDKDRTEINSMLQKFTEDDGKISEAELETGFSELMSRGYQEEAFKFLQMAQGMAGLDLKKRQIAVKEREVIIKEKELPATLQTAKAKHLNSLKANNNYDVGTPVYQKKGEDIIMITPITDKSKGVTSKNEINLGPYALLGKSKMTTGQRVGEASKIASVKQAGKDWATLRGKTIETGILSSRIKGKMTQALQLLKTIQTGGFTANVKKPITDFLGKTAGNIGLFNKLTSDILVKELKKLGTRPTDADLKYIEDKLATLGQSTEVNVAIIEDIIREMDKDVKAGDWLVTNTNPQDIGGLDLFNKAKTNLFSTPVAENNDPAKIR